jgi:hypothetical protein
MIVRLLGGILIAVGILVMTCSGLCSLLVVAGGFRETLRTPTIILLPLFVGGVPFALGFGAFRWGQVLLRRSDREDD